MDRVLSLIVDLSCISSLSFIPLSPSNLRPFGAPPSIGRREYPREPLPLEGAAEHSEAGLASFFAALGCSRIMAHLRRSPLSFIPPEPYPARFARHLPHAGKALCRRYRFPRFVAFPLGKGNRAAVDRVLSYIVDLRHISSLFFTPPSPSNLRPFGAPPSIGRRECPREPLPLEGAAERSEAGLASFLGGEAASSLPSSFGKGVVLREAVDRVLS